MNIKKGDVGAAMELKYGDIVRLQAYGGREIERRVVDVDYRRGVVCICKEDEFKKSQSMGLEPVCVGFKFQDVVEKVDRKEEV